MEQRIKDKKKSLKFISNVFISFLPFALFGLDSFVLLRVVDMCRPLKLFPVRSATRRDSIIQRAKCHFFPNSRHFGIVCLAHLVFHNFSVTLEKYQNWWAYYSFEEVNEPNFSHIYKMDRNVLYFSYYRLLQRATITCNT